MPLSVHFPDTSNKSQKPVTFFCGRKHGRQNTTSTTQITTAAPQIHHIKTTQNGETPSNNGHSTTKQKLIREKHAPT
ncbi:hypothetical protein [Tunturiibacter gelidoferens]|uniref:Uncharacterized protein n=1 Tax=Tunturiibacter gelidiferens TaxID=3069689 RepID=A0A9X0QEN1_9BACT|nr:hypothetical protein [Edaphobacter lichenicola]MBB5328849.1 hypothetical protein [Edaphobacter lichenicola]